MEVKGRINFPIIVTKSFIHGLGAFSRRRIPARKKIGSLGGRVISKREGRMLAKQNSTIALVELWNGKSLDASGSDNCLRYINHSCSPNTYMRTIGVHVEFYALKDIGPFEELTCNYGPTHHDGKRVCKCGAPDCVGYI